MYKVYHLIKKIDKEFTFNEFEGELLNLMEGDFELNNRGIFLIFNTERIAVSFFKELHSSIDGRGWMIIKKENPCQSLPDISYYMPNGIEVTYKVLKNK